ncbi:MAG: hypothetical protein IJ446_11160 [Oscillospiraceae bacterium]|nr:hypothetical protein [Oscillospiraceae bacterium]
MNMKLSYRDKIIFIVVIVILVLVVGFFVFIKARITESQDVKNNLTLKEQEKSEVESKINTLSDLEAQLKNDIKEVDSMQEPFLDEHYAFQADQYLYDLLKDTGITFKSMEIAGETEGMLSQYFYTRNALAYDLKMNADLSGDSLDQEVYDEYYATVPSAADDVKIAVDEVIITYGVPADSETLLPDWDIVLKTFDAISKDDKTLYIKAFEAGEGDDGGGEEASEPMSEMIMTVDVYSIHHMDTAAVK